LDVIEIDAASNRGIDEIRDLREKVNFAPSEATYKFYILDEVHMLTTEAFNALLKTLEEPPSHAVFVLVTTESHRLPATILSRCQRFDFQRIGVPDLVARMSVICEAEGIKIELSALELVGRLSTGSLRDAESLLDQLVS
jgi:DNA polymerase-3 subunit gamma/tau